MTTIEELAELRQAELELRSVSSDADRTQEEQQLLTEILWQETLRLQEISQSEVRYETL